MSASIDPFQAIAISHLAHRLKAQGRSIIHMEFGQPSTGAPKAAIKAAHHVLDTDAMGYWESPQLKARIARDYHDRYGLIVDPERVILTCGASPALVLALASSFQPGDRIATARPGYVAYRNTLKALHMVPVEIGCGPAERFQLTAAALAALEPAPAGVIIASPANPTGTIIAPAELAAIAEVCRARGIRIVSDEIYHGLSYVEPAASMLQFEPRALIVNSFSKYYSMVGWRLGWLLVPEDEIGRAWALNHGIKRVRASSTSAAPTAKLKRMKWLPSTGSKSTPGAAATPVSRRRRSQKARLSVVRWPMSAQM